MRKMSAAWPPEGTSVAKSSPRKNKGYYLAFYGSVVPEKVC